MLPGVIGRLAGCLGAMGFEVTTSRIVQGDDTSRLARTYRHAYTVGKPSRGHAGIKDVVRLGEKVLWRLE
jgi:hypothetical protein